MKEIKPTVLPGLFPLYH